MYVKEIAEKLNGLGYRSEPDKDIINDCKDAGIVIIFGASDDLMEMRGAVDDEIGCYDGGTVLFTPAGLIKNQCDADDCPYHLEERKKAVPVDALWCKEGDYSWTYKTEIPHETFDIQEDGEPYCRGIVFKLSDVKETT